MADSSSPSIAATAPLDYESDSVRYATCPMCHTASTVTQNAIDGGGDWRCARCGQHWDGERLGAVAAYAEWLVERARLDGPKTGDRR